MSIKLDKRAKSVVAVYAILLVIYILAFLVVPFQKNAASWICFCFTIIAFVCSLITFGLAFGKKEAPVSRLYGFPIFRVGVVYASVQFIVGILICVIEAFVSVPYWVALLVAIILLGAAAIGVIVTDNTRDMIEEVDESIKVDTKKVTFFQINIAGIIDFCENDEVKEMLGKLNELFLYSDPVTNDATKDIEDTIETMLVELKSLVPEGDADEIKILIKKITNTLNERNRVCMVSKS